MTPDLVLEQEIKQNIRALGNPAIAAHSQRFFKTGKGEYGEGDLFLGIRVPVVRKLVSRYKQLNLETIAAILRSPYHEERLFALLALVAEFKTADEKGRTNIYGLYLDHTKFINNWDLVDSSAYLIVGPYLDSRDKDPLYSLATSSLLWERRISMIACLHFIRKQQFDTPIRVAAMLVNDSEDLIHKAVGWMLREIGKRNLACEEDFLKDRYHTMPRTMLRYAIEKFPKSKRHAYLQGRI